MSTARGLEFICLMPGSGYGDAACEYAAGLDSLGYGVSWVPILDGGSDPPALKRVMRDVPGPIHQQMRRLWNNPIETEAFLLDAPPPGWHSHWLEARPGLRPFCYAAWEADRLHAEWPAALNDYETVFVPSRFNKEVFEAGGVTTRVEVLPHIARQAGAGNEELPLGLVKEEDFVFYTMGTWTSRKAMDQTIRAYLDAFGAEDPVALVIKTDDINLIALKAMRKGDAPNMEVTTAWAVARILAEYDNPAKIHLLSGRISPGQVDTLHDRGDCFISLTHSEGWGLCSFDAALAGNPVIMTGWGGQLDYLGDDYPFLVDYSLRKTDQYPDDGCFLRAPDAQWAQAEREHATDLMRRVFNQPSDTRLQISGLAAQLSERFSPSRVCGDLASNMGLSKLTA